MPGCRRCRCSRISWLRAAAVQIRLELATFLAAGYSERHALELVLAIAVKTISNYSNHLFHTQIDPVFASYGWDSAKRT